MAPIGASRSGLFSLPDAIPDSVVDNFEEALYEDQAKSLSDYYSGDLASFSRQQSIVNTGSYALEASADANIGAASAPNTSPEKGDTIECYTYIDGGDDSGIAWGTDGPVSSGDGFELDIDSGNNALFLRKYSGGSQSSIASSTPTVPSSEWLRAEITWATNDDITATLYDASGSQIDQLTATDPDYGNNTGISFRNGGAGSATVYWDDYSIL